MDDDEKKPSIRWDVAQDAERASDRATVPLRQPAAPSPGDARLIQVPARPPFTPPEPPRAAGQPEDPTLVQWPDSRPEAAFSDDSYADAAAAEPVLPFVREVREEKHEDDGREPFDRPDAAKLGIIGGKGVGKSYLFQAMVFRSYSAKHSGALTYYLERDGMHLFEAEMEPGEHGWRITNTGAARTVNRADFVDKYKNWERLAFTMKMSQHWYRLRLLFRTGLLGRTRSAMDVEFFDASGEGLLGATALSREDQEVWDRAYLTAGVMVFCLPTWAAFPATDLTDADWRERDLLLSGFEQVVKNYNDMRTRHGQTKRVRSILALTMSDDRRSALQTLQSRWIAPYLDSPYSHLKELRTGGGVARYLRNARTISEALHEEFASARDPRAASIPQSLDFGKGEPWIVPLSAIDGARLDYLQETYKNPDDPRRLREVRGAAPVPVHVELPLLLALCERENALM
jgi:hypothetical protein